MIPTSFDYKAIYLSDSDDVDDDPSLSDGLCLACAPALPTGPASREGNPITGDYGEYVGSGLEKPKQTKWIYYTPRQVQENVDLEWRYIRMMRSKLQTIKNKMSLKGLLSYSPGNIILIHLEKGKTKKKHEKIRRVFNEIAVFFCYQNGNVICRLLKPYLNYTPQKDGPFKFHPSSNTSDKYIKVPIIYTKFVCKSIESLPKDYIEYFGLQNYFHKSDVPKSLTIPKFPAHFK